jgi:hypothetical protein
LTPASRFCGLPCCQLLSDFQALFVGALGRGLVAMAPLHGDDQSVIALWLGRESVETTQMYTHADLRLKKKALGRIAAPDSKPGRYWPDDSLLAFLEGL